MTAVVDMDLASGDLYIYILIAGSLIIWQGTCVFPIASYFSDLRSPLLSFECVLCARLLLCKNLVLSPTEVKSENSCVCPWQLVRSSRVGNWLNIPDQTGSI